MNVLPQLIGIVFAVTSANGQLAAIFDKVEQHSLCSQWSSWGDCIWLRHQGGSRANMYLDQLPDLCKKHWFYDYIGKNWGVALNNFFEYLKSVTTNRTPCGMCAYRQSCGYGGPAQCEKMPFQASRPILPFNVAEQICTRRELTAPQNEACFLDYAVLKRNGGECTVWPSTIPRLPGIPTKLKEMLYKVKWSNCIPDRRRFRGRPRYCRCCCYPFKPDPRTFKCVHMGPGHPPAPGLTRG